MRKTNKKTYKMRRHKRYKYMKGGEDGDEIDETAQTDDCPICFYPLDEDVHTTECNHRFHNRCINQLTRNECPMCRQPKIGRASCRERV